MNALSEQINDLAVALVALTTALAGLTALALSFYAKIRALRRENDILDRQASVASRHAEHAQTVAAGTVASVDKALDLNDPEVAKRLPPETREFLRQRMKDTQINLGVQRDVNTLIHDVRKRAETPDTGIKLPPGDMTH